MDDSRSSELLSENAELSGGETVMDVASVQELVRNTKEALKKDVAAESQHSFFRHHFGSILEDCVNCVYQLLSRISMHLDDPNLEFSDLIQTVEDMISILELLTNFMKNVTEAVTMTCRDMKTFPVYTGQILHAIFTHCKESQNTYGFHLKTLEQQLKDLFRTCHELQKAYLNILEKSFVFNLIEVAELDILIEALEINLEIGEIVTSLDVKTLAEQWKAYIMICEKYSNYLLDRNVFRNSTASLCRIVEGNIKTAEVEKDQALTRALKVAAFGIKILAKMCHIFKRSLDRDLNDIVELLIFIQMQNAAYLKYQNKSLQYIQMVSNHVIVASDAITCELLDDLEFINNLLQYDLERFQNEDTIFGYTLLLVSVMKILVQKSNAEINTQWLNAETNLVRKVFELLPLCHPYINLDLEFIHPNDSKTTGLYELMLIHTTALAVLFDSEQYKILERILYESLMGTNLYGSLFASDLWVIMARNIADSNLTSNQIISLCEIYRKLESNKLFQNSPQQLHLSLTIERLYKNLSTDDKTRIFNHLDLNNIENRNLWDVFKIKNFPTQMRSICEEVVVSDLNRFVDKLNSKDMRAHEIGCLIKTMKQASTCSFKANLDPFTIADLWLKLCPENYNIFNNISLNLLAIEYVLNLQRLTMSVMHHLQRDSACVTKILHVISNVLTTCCLEIKLILLKIVVNLSLYNHQNAKIDFLLSKTFKKMFGDDDKIFKGKLFQRIRQHYRNKTVENIVSSVLSEDLEVKSQFDKFIKEDKLTKNKLDQFKFTLPLEYTHKCVEKVADLQSRENSMKSEGVSQNFDFAEVDSVLESDSEHKAKKAKLELSDSEQVMCRIEKDVNLLCDMKNVHSSDYRSRVAAVCEKLNYFVQ